MSFLFFLVVPTVVYFLLSSPVATHGLGRMMQGLDGTVPLPNMSEPTLALTLPTMPTTMFPILPNRSAPTKSDMAMPTIAPDMYDFQEQWSCRSQLDCWTPPDKPCFYHCKDGVCICWSCWPATTCPKPPPIQPSDDDVIMPVWMIVTSLLVLSVIQTSIICIWAAFYKSKVTDRRHGFPSPVPPQYRLKREGEMFPFSTFSCFEDCETSAFGLFCQPCRLGDTMTQAGASSYWAMVICYVVGGQLAFVLQSVLVADQFTNDGMPMMLSLVPGALWIGMCILLAVERKKLRRSLGGKGGNNNLKILGMDLCCYCWCFCCTIIQDARTVDGAADTAVRCPCRLVRRLNMLDAVGEPVSVSEDESSYSSQSD